MCAAHRRDPARLIAQLLAAPQRFEFVQAVRILLAWLAGQGIAAYVALHTCLRFENSLRLGFPGAEIEALMMQAAALPGDAASAPLPQFTLTPGFMGLLGVHGTLPLYLTERVSSWQSVHHDEAPRAFFDLLSGRMLALFYRAWYKHRLEHADGTASARLPTLLLALAGRRPLTTAAAGTEADAASDANGYACADADADADAAAVAADADAAAAAVAANAVAAMAALPNALAIHFAGLVQQRPLSAAVLERLLGDYFACPVRVLQAHGYWERLLPLEQTALGAYAALGETTLLGERSWRPDLRARLRIGPLRAPAFADFLPNARAASALRTILAAFAEPTVSFEVQLVLHGRDVRPSQLASADRVHACLGRNSFLLSREGNIDRADMRYIVAPMAALPALPLAPCVQPARRAEAKSA